MYKVTCLYGGTTYTLHDPLSDELRIYNDQLDTEDNKPGTFEFTVAFDHPYLDKIVGLSSDIRVYDGADEIWRGRPIDDGEDLYRARKFTCEGELAFFYDSIQPRRELHNVTPLAFLTLLINEHNAQVSGHGPIDKTFQVGTVTVLDDNNSLYRYTNRETTLDCIGEKLINRLGGHLSVRVSNGTRYIDYLADVSTVSDQPIQLGDNLMDYAKDTDYTQVATACIPLGAALEETEIAALDAYLTVASVNSGSDTIQIATAVQRYGFICKVLHFDDITVAANLKTAGQKWLTDGQYEQMTLTLTAVDLHALGYDLQPLRINTQVRCVSASHGMDRYFEVSKRTYHLTQPETDTVVFGQAIKKTYTSSAHSQVSSVKQHAEQLRQNIDSVIEQERTNVTNIINQATHGYVVMDPNSGPERILIMDTNNIQTAQKMWKWDLNGLAYSSTGINGPWSTAAITMNGEISANFITTGSLTANLITAGTLKDAGNNFSLNMSTGSLTMKKGSINIGNGTFQVSTAGALTATSADIKGTILCGNSNGYYARLNSVGQLEGGYSSTRYGYIDFSAKVKDIDHSTQSNPVYWTGLQVQGEILRITTDVIAVYKGTNTGSTSTNGGTGTITYMNNFHWDSSDEKWHWTNNNLRFINGIMVTSL